MNEYTNAEKDFKKWISFNNQLSEFQNLYELYTAVESKQSKGGISFKEISSENGSCFVVEQEGYTAVLEIENETKRKHFLEYLVQHYFPNDEIEAWYKSKIEEQEKNENHTIARHNVTPTVEKPGNFKIHPKETRYYNLRVFFSALFYLVILGVMVGAFISSMTTGVIVAVSFVTLILFFALTGRVVQGLFIGLLKGNTVRLNENQYSEIYKIVKEQANALELPEIPDVYIAGGHFNAFVTKFARRKYLMLYSEVLETAARGEYDVIKFVIAHELGHIKRKHLTKEVWLIPSLFIPFLKSAHSRGCEYTCDRIGYHFSNKGAFEGILILATGKEVHSKINIDRYIKDANQENNFWVWLSEKFLTHPHIFNRMTAIKNYEQRSQ